MKKTFLSALGASLAVCLVSSQSVADQVPDVNEGWRACGWGGGGFYWAAAFHPAKSGVIYLGGDVAGVYKSEDHGSSFRMINRGLANYGVYSLAVDPLKSAVVYAATEGGLCRSNDEGEHWSFLPKTGPKDLHLTGERNKSIRCIAASGDKVFAVSPAGRICRSTDGGQNWTTVFEVKPSAELADTRGIQFGKVNDAYFGGFWTPVQVPVGLPDDAVLGLGFTLQGDGAKLSNAFITLTLKSGAKYRSRNLNEEFANKAKQELFLKTRDFGVDPEWAKKHAGEGAALPDAVSWKEVNRIDLACSGALPSSAVTVRLGDMYLAALQGLDGAVGTSEKPVRVPVKSLLSGSAVSTYGNIKLVSNKVGPIYSVAISPADSNFVAAASQDLGVIASRDGGEHWMALGTPPKATSVAFCQADPNLLMASFQSGGVMKSLDKGLSWSKAGVGIGEDVKLTEVAISPVNPREAYAVGSQGWSGKFYRTLDGGGKWESSTELAVDKESDPTSDNSGNGKTSLSTPTNVAVNPVAPEEVFVSANWRCVWSGNGGKTWEERNKGADISVITDVRFSGGRTYVTAMDEGAFVSDSGGNGWRQLWPLKWSESLSGHNWRVSVAEINGKTRVITTLTPWEQKHTPGLVLSEDGGKTHQEIRNGLPDYILRSNTMWGQGHPRALAADPKNPNVLYLGIDGDPGGGKPGGGLFKSSDGGYSWAQLPSQPGSRRMFFGLAVDPTDSNRIFWGACGAGGGLYRSEDGGQSWKLIFSGESWVFNLMVATDGTVYAAGQNLWKSDDHGENWKKLTKFSNGRTITGIEVDPGHLDKIWISATSWDNSANGGVYESNDGGGNWQEITADLPYVKPMVLRFNPQNRELWAAGVGLYKLHR